MREWTIAAAQYVDCGQTIAEKIANHLRFVQAAASQHCNALLFPELSLTGACADALPPSPDPSLLQPLARAAHHYGIAIIAGVPIEADGVRQPGVAIFSPDAETDTAFYPGQSACLNPQAEHTLHFPTPNDPSELPAQASLLGIGTCTCGCQQQQSVQKLQRVAHKYAIAVLKSNYAGGSALWDENGRLIVRADAGELLLVGRQCAGGWQGDLIPLSACPVPIDEIACGA